jgi:hypothetical protein
MIKLDIKAGLKEVKEKTEEQIEQSAAITWAQRAAACYIVCQKTPEKLQKLVWLLRGEDNRHEAIEHSALVENQGKFTHELQIELDKYRDAALESIK